MKLASVRLIARDIRGIVAFYETVTGAKADWLAPVFAEIVTPGASLAIGLEATVALFQEGSAEAAANRTSIVEFQVNDIDAEFTRLKALHVVHAPQASALGKPNLPAARPGRQSREPLHAGDRGREGKIRPAFLGPQPPLLSGMQWRFHLGRRPRRSAVVDHGPLVSTG